MASALAPCACLKPSHMALGGHTEPFLRAATIRKGAGTECSLPPGGVNTPLLCDFIGEHGSACSLIGFALPCEAGEVA